MAANPFVRLDLDFPVFKDHKPLVKLAKGEHLKLRSMASWPIWAMLSKGEWRSIFRRLSIYAESLSGND